MTFPEGPDEIQYYGVNNYFLWGATFRKYEDALLGSVCNSFVELRNLRRPESDFILRLYEPTHFKSATIVILLAKTDFLIWGLDTPLRASSG